MRTVALRFAENFAPSCGTIAAHEALIEKHGFVWYGKLGSPISASIIETMLSIDDSRFLLIHSGGAERYWTHFTDAQRTVPDLEYVPDYYRGNASKFSCWFKVIRFEPAAKNVMSKSVVASSGKLLSLASRHSMSPYFIIDYDESCDER